MFESPWPRWWEVVSQCDSSSKIKIKVQFKIISVYNFIFCTSSIYCGFELGRIFINSALCPIITQNMVNNRIAFMGLRSRAIWLLDSAINWDQFRGNEKLTIIEASASNEKCKVKIKLAQRIPLTFAVNWVLVMLGIVIFRVATLQKEIVHRWWY